MANSLAEEGVKPDTVSLYILYVTPAVTEGFHESSIPPTPIGKTNISASAQDPSGIQKVDFYVGGALIGTKTASPYTVSWDTKNMPNDGILDVNSPFVYHDDPNLIKIKNDSNPFGSNYQGFDGDVGEYTQKIWIKPTIDRNITVTAQINKYEDAISTTSVLHIPKANINPVVFIPGMYGSWKVDSSTYALDPLFRTYDNIIEQLRMLGYEDGVSLFTFPYNWLDSNVNNATKMQNEIAKIRGSAIMDGVPYIDPGKVDIVAHSMGGLLSREYIQGLNNRTVDKLITVGTPHRGSAKAYMSVEGLIFDEEDGKETTLNYVIDKVMRSIAKKYVYYSSDYEGHIVTTDSDLYRFIHERVPSAFELLPDESPYLFTQVDVGKPFIAHLYGKYENNFLSNLNDNDMAELLDMMGDNPEKVVSIIGKGNVKTINNYDVVKNTDGDFKWANGEIVKYNRTDGDGTVTTLSAKLGSGMKFRERPESDINPGERLEHQKLTTQLQPTIVQELTGSKPVRSSHMSSLIDKITGNIMYLNKMCPAEFQLVDPQGRRVGYDPVTGGYVNEIPGAAMAPSKSDDWPELIIIPDFQPGDFEIKVFPRGNGGSFDIDAGAYYPEENLSQEISQLSGTISPGQQLEYNISAQDQPDVKKPVTTAQVNGPQGNNGWYKGDITVSFEATDDMSGVPAPSTAWTGG